MKYQEDSVNYFLNINTISLLKKSILEEWKSEISVKSSIISYLKGAFKYRHWLAHGKILDLKIGKPKYDFYELYKLALEVEKFTS